MDLRPVAGARRVVLGTPLVGREVHAPIQEEAHSLPLQQAALGAGIAHPEVRTARPALLDDPVAGDAGPVGVPVHGPPDHAGGPGRPEHPGDLAVGSHPSPRDPGHQGVHPGEETRPPG